MLWMRSASKVNSTPLGITILVEDNSRWHTDDQNEWCVCQTELLRIFDVAVAASGLAIGKYVHNFHHRSR